jgi:hypothetical protein
MRLDIRPGYAAPAATVRDASRPDGGDHRRWEFLDDGLE